VFVLPGRPEPPACAEGRLDAKQRARSRQVRKACRFEQRRFADASFSPKDHSVTAVAQLFRELLKTGALALAPDERRTIVVHIIGRR
jgi:hypothetical protein